MTTITDRSAFADAVLERHQEEIAESFVDGSSERLEDLGDQRDHHTGPLIEAIDYELGDREITIEYDHPASSYLDQGTVDHTVRAQQAESLAFEWPDAPAGVDLTNGMFFAQEVEVSGIDPYHFVEAGRLRAERLMRSL